MDSLSLFYRSVREERRVLRRVINRLLWLRRDFHSFQSICAGSKDIAEGVEAERQRMRLIKVHLSKSGEQNPETDPALEELAGFDPELAYELIERFRAFEDFKKIDLAPLAGAMGMLETMGGVLEDLNSKSITHIERTIGRMAWKVDWGLWLRLRYTLKRNPVAGMDQWGKITRLAADSIAGETGQARGRSGGNEGCHSSFRLPPSNALEHSSIMEGGVILSPDYLLTPQPVKEKKIPQGFSPAASVEGLNAPILSASYAETREQR